MTINAAQPIVVVEDSEDDYEATERALKRDGVLLNPILHFDNGEDALNYILHRPPYDRAAAPPRPELVLLDLNMPGVDGREVLAAIKGNAETRSIPVIVLTTSDDAWDINHCYQAGANSYIKKPVAMDRFFAALGEMKSYWLGLALLPRED